MAFRYSSGVRNTRLDAVDTAVGSSGWLMIYSSTNTAAGTIVFRKQLNNPAFAAASTNTIALNVTGLSTTAIADAGLNTACIRAASTGGTRIVDQLAVSTAGGGGDIIVDSTAASSGQTITVTSGAISHGNNV